jgi:5-methylthioadenosine/S-adenosylhomocysteine deaminase
MQVDHLIQARWIIPVEPVSVIHENYSLVIDDGKIIDLLDTAEALKKYQKTARLIPDGFKLI